MIKVRHCCCHQWPFDIRFLINEITYCAAVVRVTLHNNKWAHLRPIPANARISHLASMLSKFKSLHLLEDGDVSTSYATRRNVAMCRLCMCVQMKMCTLTRYVWSPFGYINRNTYECFRIEYKCGASAIGHQTTLKWETKIARKNIKITVKFAMTRCRPFPTKNRIYAQQHMR